MGFFESGNELWGSIKYGKLLELIASQEGLYSIGSVIFIILPIPIDTFLGASTTN
jgi:hypothetical protein